MLAELESERRSVPLLEEALREAASRPALQSVIHCRLAWASSKPGFDHARRALELADELDDDQLRGQARAMQAILGWFAGEAEAPEDLPARVRDFPSAVGGELLVREATLAVVNTLAPAPKRDEARLLLQREYEAWRERDEPRSSRALWGLAWVEFWAGRWALGAEYAARARDISIQYGLEMPQDQLPSAVIAVYRGQLDLAREHSERGLDLALRAVPRIPGAAHGCPRARRPLEQRSVRGQELVREGRSAGHGARVGRAECPLVDSRLRRAASRGRSDRRRRSNRRCLGGGCGASGPRVGVGERDPMPWSRRRRGGGRRRAASLLERRVAQHEEVGDPVRRARALLGLGIVQRRARKKRVAREAIQAALDGFEELGAATWVEKARGELGRIGGRTREEGLTPPSAASPRWSQRVGRTGRSPRRSSSPSGRSPATCPTSTPSSACGRERSSPAGCGEYLGAKVSVVLTFRIPRTGA